MKVLFIGGTGNISSACVELALLRAYQVSILTRGTRPATFSKPVTTILGDRNDAALLERVGKQGHYDVVANFVGYTPDQVGIDVAAFAGQVGQYIFISSASAYQKPPTHYVITEDTPLENPFWQYSRDKIACERALMRAHRERGFPVTIVRPSHTFGPTRIPSGVGGHGCTIVGRMRQGKPIISHGDGQSLWVITFHTDFALGFVGLFGNRQALGEAFHITTDEVLTWDQIYRTIAHAAGCEARIVHISSDFLAALYPELGPGLLGDKAYSVVFDNSKIKRTVPGFVARVSFAEGIARSIAWHDADPSRRVVDDELNAKMDHLIEAHQRAMVENVPRRA